LTVTALASVMFTVAGVNVAVTPAGMPSTASVTPPVSPPAGVSVSVYDLDSFRRMVSVALSSAAVIEPCCAGGIIGGGGVGSGVGVGVGVGVPSPPPVCAPLLPPVPVVGAGSLGAGSPGEPNDPRQPPTSVAANAIGRR
jgi:hypothetical protein